jgi:hypothetical protein
VRTLCLGYTTGKESEGGQEAVYIVFGVHYGQMVKGGIVRTLHAISTLNG